jgi:FixJ family two-component response regulator
MVSNSGSWVIVVDDDADMRDALSNLFQSVGLNVTTYGSADELLKAKLPDTPSCLVLDIRLPGVNGLDFQAHLAKSSINLPIIFITGYGDVPMTVRAMKAGAVDFLTKPFRDQDMLDAVSQAIEHDREQRQADGLVLKLRALYKGLTPREAEVMAFVTQGLLNKQVAGKMGLSEITVKIHRSNMMRKMSARSLADLVRMGETLELHKV